MSEKPIREYDRFIVRLPDGLRERLQQRAKLNDRSMNAEVVSMLENGLSNRPESEIEALTREYEKLQSELQQAQAHAAAVQERMWTIQDQIEISVNARQGGK